MSAFSNKKDKSDNYVIKILNNIDEINNILKRNNYLLKSYKYDLEIYMINKNENFANIRRLEDIKEYAIIKDENGNRKIILKNENCSEAKIYSIFLANDLLYNLGYYQLFYINKDVYHYEIEHDKKICFEILDVKEQGCFLKFDDVSLNSLKSFIINLKEIGVKVDDKDLKLDIIQQELNKVLFKRK